MPLRDAYNREIKDLRISLTDRCNFRCFYCLPNGEPPLARKDTILTFEEIYYAASLFVELGIEKIRLTGGEPMLRRDLPKLVSSLDKLRPGLKDLALTTNGYSIPAKAAELKHAGIDRLTLSLDTLQRERFKEITGVDSIEQALDALSAAKEHGFTPVKINAVIVRGVNDDELADFARFAREHAVEMRFIEYMPLDSGHGWDRSMVVSGKEIFETISAVYQLKVRDAERGSDTAAKFTFADGAPGGIGIIAPVTEMFCGKCSRIRLTADGQIRTCLFSESEYDLRSLLRSGASRPELLEFIETVTLKKEAGHQINDASFVQPARTMSFIGG
jgi:GTP 3',8-cyclase